MRNIKQQTEFPEWARLLARTDQIVNQTDAYQIVPLVFRCVNLRANSITQIPHHIEDEAGNEVDWPYAVDLTQLIWQTEASALLRGAAYWLKLRNMGMQHIGVQWLNPFFMTVSEILQVDANSPEGLTIADPAGQWQFSANSLMFHYASTVLRGTWTDEDIVYFKEFNPNVERLPGYGTTGTAMQSAQLQHYINRFSTYFFQGGAMPITVLGVEGNPDPDDLERIRGFFKRMASGIRNVLNVVPLRSSITPAILTPPLRDMALDTLKELTAEDVADAYSIPIAKLRDPNNRATADVHDQAFYRDTVVPRAKWLASVVNEQFFGENDQYPAYSLKFDHQKMDIFKAEESARSKSLIDLTSAGVPLDMALDVLGFYLTDEQKQDIQQVTLQKETERQENRDQRNKAFEQSQQQAQSPFTEAQQQRDQDKKLWRKKALKHIGKPFKFNTAYFSEFEHDVILVGLGHCHTPEQVKNFFTELDEHLEWAARGYKVVLGPDNGETDPRQLRLEKKFVSSLSTWFRDQVDRLISALSMVAEVPDEAFWVNEDNALATWLTPYTTEWGEAGVVRIVEQLQEVTIGLDAQANAIAQQFARSHAVELAKGLNKTTRQLTGQTIATWLQTGEPFQNLVKALPDKIGPKWRKELIASTEVTRALGVQAQQIAEDNADVIKTVVNLTANDERVCPICGPIHGAHRPIKGVFPGTNLDTPPYHPRCRCGLVYAV